MSNKTASKGTAVTVVTAPESIEVDRATRAAWLVIWATLFAPTTKPAWIRQSYMMIRGDRGTSAARTAVLLADGTSVAGTWLTICEHGTSVPTSKGARAEDAGRLRATWCKACETGTAPTLAGLPGSTATADMPVKAPRKARAPRKVQAAQPSKAEAEKAAREAAAALLTDAAPDAAVLPSATA